jgi:hypothetical protein
MNLDKTYRTKSKLTNTPISANNNLKIIKCSKCKKFNSIVVSPEIKNTNNCYFCGNPFYIISTN